MENIHDELRELDEEYQHQQGEKSQKYKELKQKEQQIDEFLETFEQTKVEDQQRINELQKNIVKLLQLISKVCIFDFYYHYYPYHYPYHFRIRPVVRQISKIS